MAKVVVGMTVSLDGFVADQGGSVSRLYWDLDELRTTPYMSALIAETGAVLMGKKTFQMGDPDSYVGNYEFQVPIFVLTHEPPAVLPAQDENLTFTFLDDLASAVERAKAAAGGKAVQVVGGPSVAQQLLNADLVDELRLDVMPVLLGGGVRFFDSGVGRVRLGKLDVQEIGARTSLTFRLVS